ncbi:LytTR family transcriptional regulator DNA-binding domain-containing protein [Dyadobacter sp. 50-39]|uniref:LytTR family transcriptional regulator DNA-binding domain-containing protein n=1 Tax=Dyadobacter sp. 50-39 TaxID=1895756 RepID=UPI0038D44EB6
MVTREARHIVYRRVKDLKNSLPGYFQRIHHSYIVNLNNIDKVEHNQVYRLSTVVGQ